MPQSISEVNVNAAPNRKKLRHVYTFAAGLLAVAVAAAIIVEERSASALTDSPKAGDPLRAGAVIENSSSGARTLPVSDTARRHFQRSDEPATDDDPTHPYGG